MTKGKRHTDEQIVGILREMEIGKPITEVCRMYGVAGEMRLSSGEPALLRLPSTGGAASTQLKRIKGMADGV